MLPEEVLVQAVVEYVIHGAGIVLVVLFHPPLFANVVEMDYLQNGLWVGNMILCPSENPTNHF
jgi:hypothetical protein